MTHDIRVTITHQFLQYSSINYYVLTFTNAHAVVDFMSNVDVPCIS